MVNLYGETLDKKDLLRSVGSMEQVMGAREVTLRGGKQDGVRAVEVYNDTGFRFTVLVDKGMDIYSAGYQGKSLAWECKNGVVAPWFFENGGDGFFRGFAGGLVATCGLTQVGVGGTDGDAILGLHDRLHNLPAHTCAVDAGWEGERYRVRIVGEVRQSSLYGENLVLRREITCRLGEAMLRIDDTVVNEGFDDAPFMLMYHCNFGYPLIGPHTRIYSPARGILPSNDAAESGVCKALELSRPVHRYPFECYVHSMPQRERVTAGLVNHRLEFGAFLRYSPRELPIFNAWKMMGEQDYAMAFEPGTNMPEGRIAARQNGRLRMLAPGERFTCALEIGAVTGTGGINGLIGETRGE